jgi:hypothetical protein
MDRKQLEKLAWRATHPNSRSKWNKGEANVLKYIPGKGTCLVYLSTLTDEELRVIARLEKEG